jgi:hypothetical protein
LKYIYYTISILFYKLKLKSKTNLVNLINLDKPNIIYLVPILPILFYNSQAKYK